MPFESSLLVDDIEFFGIGSPLAATAEAADTLLARSPQAPALHLGFVGHSLGLVQPFSNWDGDAHAMKGSP